MPFSDGAYHYTSHAGHNSIIEIGREYKRTIQRKHEILEKIYYVAWKS